MADAVEDAQSPLKSHLMEAIRSHLHFKNPKMIALFGAMLAYFVIAIAIYMPGEGWGAGDCIYFAVVVVTTVGYGDLLPTSPSMKVATILFAHFGLSIVVLALGVVQDILTHQAMHSIVGAAQEVGLFDQTTKARKKKRKAGMLIFLYLLWLMIGTIGLGLMFSNNEESESEWPFLDGCYLTVITLTTIGFGDLGPMDDGSKILCIVLMLFGVPAFGSAFAAFNNAIFPDINSSPLVLQKIQGSLTKEKYETMEGFIEKMRHEGLEPSSRDPSHAGEGKISRLEFLSFILVENGVVELKNIRNVLRNFDELDKSRTGYIDPGDVAQASQSVRAQAMSKQAVGKPSNQA